MKKIIAFFKSLFVKAPVKKVSVETYTEVKEEIVAVNEAIASQPEVKKAPKKSVATNPAAVGSTGAKKKKTSKSKAK